MYYNKRLKCEVDIAMKPLKEHISITLDADVLEKARAEAERCDRSLSQFINIVLKDYLNSDKESNFSYMKGISHATTQGTN